MTPTSKPPILSLAGTWVPVDTANLVAGKNNGGLAQTTYAHLTVGGGSALLIAGWGWSGGFGDQATLAAPEQVHVALLAPRADGTLALATSAYLSSDLINGANAAITADFNGDGKTDVFLPAHNESPFKAEPSTLYLSNAKGSFDKTTLADSVMAHDAELASPGGVPTVFTATFLPGDANPVYTFAKGALQEATPALMASVFHQSVAEGNFGPGGTAAVAMGDVFSNDPGDNAKIKVYGYANGDLTSTTPLATITPYLSAKFPDQVSIYGKGITHTYRIFSDDFNHDGKLDLLAEESMWSSANNFPTVLQMLQNAGGGQFADKTDQLGSAVSQNNQELDYQPQMLDLDHSGINSYLLAGVAPGNFIDGKLVYDNARSPNYLLLNDGTGQLYNGLHAQFATLGQQVIDFLSPLQQNADGSQNFYLGSDIGAAGIPKFVAYQLADGAIDYLAEVQVGRWVTPGVWGNEYLLVNVPLHYQPATDFTDNISVRDRNGSLLMRTWAGNDIFYDRNAAAGAHIDGGLGHNEAVYSGLRAAYQVARTGEGSATVATLPGAAQALSDTLVHIDRLAFADGALALDISGSAGEAYRIYQAAFNRVPDSAGLGYWIAAMDHGASLDQVAAGFVGSAEFQARYGAHPANADVVGQFYANVLHRPGEAAGLAYWTDLLDRHAATVAQVLAGFSESPENQAALVGVIGNGIAYTPYG